MFIIRHGMGKNGWSSARVVVLAFLFHGHGIMKVLGHLWNYWVQIQIGRIYPLQRD